jgi:DNA replication protein DnaC
MFGCPRNRVNFTQLPIIDDFGLAPIDAAARHDLLEIREERCGRQSTIITSQFRVAKWYDLIGDPAYADAILDRIVHNAHRIELTGESLRKKARKPLGANLQASRP